MMPCSPVKINRSFGGDIASIFTAEDSQSFGCYMLHAGFLLGLLFDPEDGGDMIFRNVD
jgi:hypothetical protein